MTTTDENLSKSQVATRVYLDGAVRRLQDLQRTAQTSRKTAKVLAANVFLQLLLQRAKSLRDLTIYGSADLVAPGQEDVFEAPMEFLGKLLGSGEEE